MPRKLLIVCDAFPPDFAPRIGYLCKFLNADYDVTVVTEKNTRNSWPVSIERKNLQLHQFTLTSSNRVICNFQAIGDYLFSRKDRKLYNLAAKALKNSHFDMVLCTSYYIFPLLCGKKLAHRFNIPLCIDLRDIKEQEARPIGLQRIRHFFRLQWLNIWRRNQILKSANCVTTISPWHVETLSKFHNNVHLVYNGYDAEEFFYKEVKTDYFTITYTGRILDLNLRNPILLFEAVQDLCRNNDFAQSLKIKWFVDNASMQQINELSEKYGLTAHTEVCPTISAERMPEVLNSSSIALVLTNLSTENGPHGIMTTKFFEALGCERPILCIRSDESCLASAITETNSGLAGRNIEEVKEFIMNKFNEWKQNGFTHQNVRLKENFTRQMQAKQFEKIFEEIIAN